MARLCCAVLASLAALVHLASARHYDKRAASTSSSLATVSANPPISSTAGPFIGAYSYTWSQYIVPTTVGTVLIVVNNATNQTSTTTIFHTEFEKNGTKSLLTRTDTNAAGTVTNAVEDINSGKVTMTYPTNYFAAASVMTWGVVLPVTAVGNYTEAYVYTNTGTYVNEKVILGSRGVSVTSVGQGETCCLPMLTFSPTPAHTPFPLSGTLDTMDPSGWLYTLVGIYAGEATEQLDPSGVSSLWTSQTLGISYADCPHKSCGSIKSQSAAAATAVKGQANILATSTTTISSAASSNTIAGAQKQSEKPSKTTTALEANSPSSKALTSTSPTAQQSTKPAPTSQTPEAKTSQSATPKSENATPQTPKADNTPSQTVASANGVSSNPTTQLAPSTVPKATGDLSTKVPAAGSQASVTAKPGSSITIADAVSASPTSIVVGGITLVPGSSSNFVVSSQTLLLGSSITLGSESSQTVVAIKTISSQTVVVVGSLSSTLSQASTPPAVITIGSSVISANSASEFVIDGQTLTPGGGVVISGTTITDVGGYVWLGLGGGPGQATATTVSSTNTVPSSAATTRSTGATSSFFQPQGFTPSVSPTTSDSQRVLSGPIMWLIFSLLCAVQLSVI